MGVEPASIRVSVHSFRHEYLCNQQANQILSEALLGWGKGCISFRPDPIRTLVSMAADSFHMVIIGKTVLQLFLGCFSSDPFHTYR